MKTFELTYELLQEAHRNINAPEEVRGSWNPAELDDLSAHDLDRVLRMLHGVTLAMYSLRQVIRDRMSDLDDGQPPFYPVATTTRGRR